MAVYKRDLVDINLETGNIHRSFLKHSIGYKDQQADHFGVRVYRDGEPVNLTGVSVQGVFMPPQGSPIAITTGNIVSDNVAEVVLPQACYNYDGQFTLAIKLVDSTNEVTGTVRIVDGMVDNTHASGTVAPTSAVPTYQEVLSAYEQAIAVIGASVRFDQTQSLTDAQKATARSNIGALSTAEMNTALALKVNVSDIENDLTGTTAGKVLDARQGKVLDDKVSDLKSALTLVPMGNNKVIDSSAKLDEITGNTKSMDDFPVNTIIVITGNAVNWGLLNYPTEITTSGRCTVMTIRSASNKGRGLVQFFINDTNMAIRRFTNSDAWGDWIYYATSGDVATAVSAMTNALNDAIALSPHGNNLLISSKTRLENITNGTRSLNDLPVNSIITITSTATSLEMTNYPTEISTGRGTVMTICAKSETDVGVTQFFVNQNGMATRRKNTNTGTASDWTDWLIYAKPELPYLLQSYPYILQEYYNKRQNNPVPTGYNVKEQISKLTINGTGPEGLGTDGFRFVWYSEILKQDGNEYATLYKFDTWTKGVVNTKSDMEIGHANSIAYVPVLNRLYITGATDFKLHIVDADTFDVIQSINVADIYDTTSLAGEQGYISFVTYDRSTGNLVYMFHEKADGSGLEKVMVYCDTDNNVISSGLVAFADADGLYDGLMADCDYLYAGAGTYKIRVFPKTLNMQTANTGTLVYPSQATRNALSALNISEPEDFDFIGKYIYRLYKVTESGNYSSIIVLEPTYS